MKFCEVCGVTVNARGYVGHCNSLKHKNNCLDLFCDNVHLIQSAFKGRIRLYRLMPTVVTNNLDTFKQNTKDTCLSLIEEVLKEHSQLKVNFELFGLYYLQSKELYEIKSFNCKATSIYSSENIASVWDASLSAIEDKMRQFSERDSGWMLVEISYIEITLSKLKIL